MTCIKCHKCNEDFLKCIHISMSEDEWELIHEKFNTCVIGMVMGYKHGRITSTELMDLIEGYCECSYKLGTKRKINKDKK